MTISQVALSNTFNEFRSTFNDAANTVNSLTGGGGNISANSITSSTLTSGRVPLVSTAGLIVDDSNLTYNTSTDVLTLGGATDASSSTTGTLIVTGGVGVAKKLFVGTDLSVTGNTSISTNLTVTANSSVGTVISGTWNGTTIAVSNGGTGLTSTPANGAIDIGNGTGFTRTTLTSGSGITVTNTAGGIQIDATGGGGDAFGAASSTNNAIALFSGTLGKTIKNSLVTISANGAIIAPQVASIIPFYYANTSVFPSASTYHGAQAHSHADAAMYFAHGGSWIRMLDDATDVTVAQGGTGLSTLTLNNVILGNGTSTPLFVAPGSSANVLTSNGTTWQSTAPAASGVTAGKAIALSMIFGF